MKLEMLLEFQFSQLASTKRNFEHATTDLNVNYLIREILHAFPMKKYILNLYMKHQTCLSKCVTSKISFSRN
jgi:hypothetical protein